MNLYDFDNTIYKGDSSVDFFCYSLKKYPSIILNLPKMGLAGIKYKLNIIDKTSMKEVIFSFVKKIPDIDKHIDSFWELHRKNIKQFYLAKNHKDDIIISASPEFLLDKITKELEVKELIGSRVDKKTGKFTGLNCYGEEKVVRLQEKYSKIKVKEAYSDSTSDDPILKLASKAYYVKGDELIPAEF